jgi:hypothetical protein
LTFHSYRWSFSSKLQAAQPSQVNVDDAVQPELQGMRTNVMTCSPLASASSISPRSAPLSCPPPAACAVAPLLVVEEGTRIYTRRARWSSLLTARSRRMSLFGIVWHCSTRLAWGVRYCRSMSRARDRYPGQRQRMTRPLVASLEDMADERRSQITSRCFRPWRRGRPLVKKYMAPYRHRGRPPWMEEPPLPGMSLTGQPRRPPRCTASTGSRTCGRGYVQARWSLRRRERTPRAYSSSIGTCTKQYRATVKVAVR